MVLSSVLGMAVQHKKLPLADAIHIFKLLPSNDLEPAHDASAAYVIDQERALIDVDEARGERLAQDFQDMTVLDEYTTTYALEDAAS